MCSVRDYHELKSQTTKCVSCLNMLQYHSERAMCRPKSIHQTFNKPFHYENPSLKNPTSEWAIS